MLGFGQFFCGWQEYNNERRERGLGPVDASGYLVSPHFLEATTENWESEFLQMFVYIVFTVVLYPQALRERGRPAPFRHKAAGQVLRATGSWSTGWRGARDRCPWRD